MSSSQILPDFASPLVALTPEAFVNVADHYNKESATREAAIHLYKAAISLSPNKICAQAHYGLANALVFQGKDAEAIESFKTAITQKAGNYPEAHNGLGYVLGFQGKYAAAIESFKTAITQKAGKFPLACNGLGKALSAQGKYAEAIESYNKALESCTTQNHLHLKTIIQKSLEKVQSVFDKKVSEASAASAKMGLAREALANKGQKRKADDAEEETSSETQDLPPPPLLLNKVVKIEPAEYENSLCGENPPDLAYVGDLSNIVDLGGAGNPFPVSQSE